LFVAVTTHEQVVSDLTNKASLLGSCAGCRARRLGPCREDEVRVKPKVEQGTSAALVLRHRPKD
jgi:hypothetical protein